MPPFDSILFDFDGVLADTEPVHCACWAEVLAPLGIRLDWHTYSKRFIGIDDREMLRMLAAMSDPPASWDEMWKLYPRKREMFRARVTSHPPFDGALGAFLESMDGPYTMGVVSSSACAEIEPMLVAGGLREYFKTIVGGENVTHHKPAPEPYLLAAERLSLRNPLVVEDSAAGLASGRAAGFEVLAITHPAEVPDLVTRRLAL